MIKGSSQSIAVSLLVEVELFRQADVATVVGVDAFVLICALPLHEFIFSGINLARMPQLQIIFCQCWTQIVLDKHLEHFYLAQSASEVLASQCSVGSSICCLAGLDALLYLDSFLKDECSFVHQCLFTAFFAVNNGPSEAVGASIKA